MPVNTGVTTNMPTLALYQTSCTCKRIRIYYIYSNYEQIVEISNLNMTPPHDIPVVIEKNVSFSEEYLLLDRKESFMLL